jgi:beta-phosphoglucomutase-like phosphatase (HAD superfamily)
MTIASHVPSRVAGTSVHPTARRPRPALEPPAPARQPLDVDALAASWQRSLDAAQRALDAAGGVLPGDELGPKLRALAQERQRTATTLAELARAARVRPEPWLSPMPVNAQMLGLPVTVRACVFDLDGVLTDSSLLHAWAWAEVFDELLLRLGETHGWHFIPFDRDADYRAYIDGRPRLEGVHTFLASRGIRLPEGRPDDPAESDTAYGVGKRKNEALTRGLQRRGVNAVAGARRYLDAAGRAGLARAVVSASASTLQMLELAGLATLVEACIDADAIRVEGLRSRPAPDVLLAACRRVGVRPDEAVAFTQSPAGVAAAHAAGSIVIGVGERGQAELLTGFGAERVVPSLSALLDPRLAERP